MKIEKLTTNNFKGLEGKREYDLSNGIVAFCQSNGAGKTSIIEALRFVLAGTTTSEMVFRGQSCAFAQIETESGNTYSRKIHADSKRGVECMYNGKKMSARDLNDRLAAETGVAVENAKIASSGELLTGLSSQQLGDVLLRYLPEQLTKEIFLEKLPNATASQIKIVSELVDKMLQGREPDEEGLIHFDTKMVDLVYGELTERRKQLKKNLGEKEAVIRQFESFGQASGTMESCQKEKENLMQRRDAAIVYNTKKQAYDRAVLELNKHNNQLAALDAEINAITAVMHAPEERTAVAEAMQSVGNTGTALYNSLSTLQTTIKTLQVAIERIKEPVCPLSEKLACTTDKTPIVSDLQKQGNEAWASYQEQQKQYKVTLEEYNKLKAQLAQIDADNTVAQKKETLMAQKKQLLANPPIVPEAPGQAENVQEIDARLKQIEKNMYVLTNATKCEQLKKTVEAWKAMLNDYEYLVTQFSPKGAVKEAITAYYLDDFAETVNEKAERLKEHMTVKFVSDKGVIVLVDVNGSGNYLPYTSLSGGEQACVMFLLLDLLSTLSGFGVIILDELSVLDSQMFEKLITLMKENYAFETVVISAVDHEDTVKAIKAHDIPIIAC